jgi:hypothetical protein
MRKVLVLTPIGLLFFCISISAQPVNADSIALVSKIEADKTKLGDLQIQLDQKLKDKQEALSKAQRSANENEDAASKLSNNPRHKKLARKADKKATDARKDAKVARRETERVDDLNKEIKSTQKRIAKNEGRLKKYTQPRTKHKTAK